MNRFLTHSRLLAVLTTIAVWLLAGPGRAAAGMLVEVTREPFANEAGADYLRYSGRFVGETSKGQFRVPFEIVAPADLRRSNRTVVFEAPHFLFGTAGRDATLGAGLLFSGRYSHASVGFSNEGFNLLDPFVADAMVAGTPVIANRPPVLRDVGIIGQFVDALRDDPAARAALGKVRHRYAYGVSQSAEALYELCYGPGCAGLFDLTVLHVPLWRPPFARPDVLAALPEDFTPLPDIGRVMIVSAEGDLLISESLELRNATSHPNFRVYEVAGAPHLPDDSPIAPGLRTNPLDLAPVVRAAFVRGNLWVRHRYRPPHSRLLAAAGEGDIDPVYFVETGIARNADGNAAGGVRFPDVETGRAFFLASALDVEVFPGLAGLIGFWSDLACAPPPGSPGPAPRFSSRADYVINVWRQAVVLLVEGHLLFGDAVALVRDAIGSDVGSPGTCH